MEWIYCNVCKLMCEPMFELTHATIPPLSSFQSSVWQDLLALMRMQRMLVRLEAMTPQGLDGRLHAVAHGGTCEDKRRCSDDAEARMCMDDGKLHVCAHVRMSLSLGAYVHPCTCLRVHYHSVICISQRIPWLTKREKC